MQLSKKRRERARKRAICTLVERSPIPVKKTTEQCISYESLELKKEKLYTYMPMYENRYEFKNPVLEGYTFNCHGFCFRGREYEGRGVLDTV